MTTRVHDVVILGGGLAGLTLALQLRRRFGDIDVVVVERRAHPVPPAAHKVGESTVEIGAHYFSETLGLREHLDAEQIRKFGFRFFFCEGRSDLENVTELGVRRVLPTPTWQIDRGTFENFLGEEARRNGIDFRDGAVVRGFDIAQATAAITSCASSATARSRRSRRAGSSTPRAAPASSSASSASPKRTATMRTRSGSGSTTGSISTQWCADAEWQTRCTPQERWRSTNHFCGPGYWAWLIPLGSGAHSVGIVCDAKMHPLETMNTFERSLDWFDKHQPAVGRECAARRDKLMDFMFLRGFSYGCKQVFSGDRWALTGEAGVFLDPFYSPGSDFIAISNTYICELIALDRAGQPIGPYARHLRAALHVVLREHADALSRSVPDVRRRRSHADQGDLGLHVLLGRALPARVPEPADRSSRCSAACATSSSARRRSTGACSISSAAGMRESRNRNEARHARPARARLVRRDESRTARCAVDALSSPSACAQTSR